eukprot:tig00021586_g22670.t1
MAATEATLGEQIEARWGRFLGVLGAEAKEPGVRAQIDSLRGIGATAVIVLFRRHINAEAALIKSRDERIFEKLPAEYRWVRPLFFGCPSSTREKLWLYLDMFTELTSE